LVADIEGEHRLRVFENRVLRRILRPKGDKVTGEWRKLHDEELHDLYCAGHAARLGRGEGCAGFWWGNLREKGQWGDPGVDWRIILRWIFKKKDVGVWAGLGWLRIQLAGTCACVNGPSGSIQCGEFID
jgi:hypothetical protein